MNFLIADTFTASFNRLSGSDQKAVKASVFDLQMDPAGNGLQLHRIDKSKDPNFWSARVNRDIRLIVHKTGESLLVAYVGHHDDAYAWAERRRIEAHPRTGAVQIVEVRERVEEVAPPATFDFVFPEPAKGKEKETAPPALFSSLDDDALLSIGVPADWLADVRAATEDGFFALTAHLPAEASEALLEYAATGRLVAPAPPPAVADPFAHPDALRRIRLIADQEELEQALAFPWEKWGVFLHPSQRALVERSFSGPARVAGSAGTGKTIVAIHRAVRLARDNHECEGAAGQLLGAARGGTGEEGAGPGARNRRRRPPHHHGVVPRHRRADVSARARRAPPHRQRRRAARASARGGRVRQDLKGFSERFPFVRVDQCHRRLGPDVARRLFDRSANGAQEPARPQPARTPVAGVPGGARRAGGGALHDLGERLHRTWRTRSRGDRKPFDHVVIDEAQDLAPAELRFFAAMAPAKADGLFLSGDVGQRIFQHPFSWASLGVDVRGRSHTLKVCYRTSQQIRRAADKLLPTVLRDTDGLEDERRGIISVFDGPPPEVRSLDTVAAEADAVRKTVESWLERRSRAQGDRRVRPDAAARHSRAGRHRRACWRSRDDDRSHEPRQGTRISRRRSDGLRRGHSAARRARRRCRRRGGTRRYLMRRNADCSMSPVRGRVSIYCLRAQPRHPNIWRTSRPIWADRESRRHPLLREAPRNAPCRVRVRTGVGRDGFEIARESRGARRGDPRCHDLPFALAPARTG